MKDKDYYSWNITNQFDEEVHSKTISLIVSSFYSGFKQVTYVCTNSNSIRCLKLNAASC